MGKSSKEAVDGFLNDALRGLRSLERDVVEAFKSEKNYTADAVEQVLDRHEVHVPSVLVGRRVVSGAAVRLAVLDHCRTVFNHVLLNACRGWDRDVVEEVFRTTDRPFGIDRLPMPPQEPAVSQEVESATA